MSSKTRELYRIPEEAKILGVCAGLAEYFDFDVTLMRIIFFILIFITGGAAILLYFVMAFVMPTERTGSVKVESMSAKVEKMGAEMRESGGVNRVRNYAGVGLVVFGVWVLLAQLFPVWDVIQWRYLWPILLIFIGLAVVFKGKK